MSSQAAISAANSANKRPRPTESSEDSDIIPGLQPYVWPPATVSGRILSLPLGSDRSYSLFQGIKGHFFVGLVQALCPDYGLSEAKLNRVADDILTEYDRPKIAFAVACHIDYFCTCCQQAGVLCVAMTDAPAADDAKGKGKQSDNFRASPRGCVRCFIREKHLGYPAGCSYAFIRNGNEHWPPPIARSNWAELIKQPAVKVAIGRLCAMFSGDGYFFPNRAVAQTWADSLHSWVPGYYVKNELNTYVTLANEDFSVEAPAWAVTATAHNTRR